MAAIPKNLDQAKLTPQAGLPATFPATYWTLVTNVEPGWTYIVVPTGGTLWVYYLWSGNPAAQIFVWHEGGSQTPLNGGENTVAVSAGDMIAYQLKDPANDSIKLGYQMV